MSKKLFLIKNIDSNNAGDGLYSEKSELLFKKLGIDILYSCDIRDDMSKFSEKIYNCKNISTSGGPLIYNDFYKNLYSFNKINVDKTNPIFFGCGLRSRIQSSNRIVLKNETIDILSKGTIFCRDIISYDYIKNLNLSPQYSGCSTWFNGGDLVVKFKKAFDNICLSFDTNPTHIDMELVDRVIRMFPKSKIKCIFNCGFNDEKESVRRSFGDFLKYCQSKGISCESCKSNFKKLESIISESDLHIGMRVHAHLCAISKGIKSVLIQVDLRGVGQTKSLMTEKTDFHIESFSQKLLQKKVEKALGSDYNSVIKIINERYNYLKNNFINFLE
jgi:hypothetical protein